MSTSGKKCAKDGCSCPAEEGKKYCSTQCEDAKKFLTLKCECGHPACSG
jgi:hypothetical protein